MGTNVSRQRIESTKENITSVINDSITEVDDNTTAYGSAKSVIEIVNEDGSNIQCKELNVSNTAKLNVTAIQRIFTDLTSDQMTDLTTKIQDELESAAEQENEGINLGQTNVSIQDTVLAQKVTTSISNSVKKSFETNVVASGNNNASTKFINSGNIDIDGDCNFSSEAVSKILAENVSDRIIKDLMGVLQITESETKVKQDGSQSNEGITMAFLIAAAVLVLLVIVAFVMIKKKKADTATSVVKR